MFLDVVAHQFLAADRAFHIAGPEGVAGEGESGVGVGGGVAHAPEEPHVGTSRHPHSLLSDGPGSRGCTHRTRHGTNGAATAATTHTDGPRTDIAIIVQFLFFPCPQTVDLVTHMVEMIPFLKLFVM